MLRRVGLLLLGILATAMGGAAEPPVLVDRGAVRWNSPLPGVIVPVDTPTSTTFSLFVPDGFAPTADGDTTLTIHFHGAAWFMQQEHVRRGAAHPLLVANAPGGDAVFEREVLAPGAMEGVLAGVEGALAAMGTMPAPRVAWIEASGFSAGYAGVRGLLRHPAVGPRVRRVLLADALYVGDAPDSAPPGRRVPRAGEDGIGPFVDFARRAMAGEVEFLFCHSATPSMRSVGPMDCSRAIIAELGMAPRPVAPGVMPASRPTADFQLIWRADAGGAHFWCYDGGERPIHLAHLRNIATLWKALDGATAALAEPPPMTPRTIAPPAELHGESVALDIGTPGTVTLFIPAGYKVPRDGRLDLTLHFHGATWFVIDEHTRRGLGEPMVALELGQGSTVYRVPFEDPTRLDRLTAAVVAALVQRGAPAETQVGAIDVTSFSAGYGAVRELVRRPETRARLRRVVLLDSFYGGLEPGALAEGRRVVEPEYVEPWLDFARDAMAGRTTLILTTSEIAPPSYAGTHEVAAALAAALDLKLVPAPAGEGPYPLRSRADSGSFHWWAYAGDDALVHMTLARQLAAVWNAVDQNGDR
jgi:hypothetical protein